MKKLLFLLMLVIGSCSLPDQKGNNQVAKKYFDLNILLQSQITQLDSLAPIVNKSISIDGKQEIKKIEKVDWNNELSIFINSDINKPKLLDQYEVNESTDGSEVHLSYEFIKKGATGVQRMQITKNKITKNIQKVEVESLERNALFSSHKNIRLVFKDNKLISYSMKGFDKVTMRDTMWYDVQGVVVY